jgi:hypothetical protein
MENLRKVISLHQASLISGYHQDYLSSLIRKKEIKGEKVGRNWFTTEEEVRRYILKKEIRHKKSIFKYFLYLKNINKNFVSGFVVLALFSFGIYLDNRSNFSENQGQATTTDTQSSLANKLANKQEVKELQF